MLSPRCPHLFKTVFVVDDDTHVLKLLRQFLSSKGFLVLTATTRKECSRLLKKEIPDLLLVDYYLPDGTGLEIVKEATEVYPDLSVIVMSGVAVQDVKVAAQAIKLGAVEYMTKPFDLQELEDQIHRSMELQERKRKERKHLKLREVFSKQLISMLEKERKQLAQELHDEIGQTLTTLKMEVELLLEELNSDDHLSDRLAGFVENLSTAIEKIRNISYGLRPSTLDSLGLEHAVRLLIKDMKGSSSTITIKPYFQGLEKRFHHDLELAAYRIVQEALNNIVKHSKATHAYLNIICKGDVLSISLEDNGSGFDVETVVNSSDAPKGVGLLTIHERADQFGGKVWIDSQVGRGTCLSVEIPLNHGQMDGLERGTLDSRKHRINPGSSTGNGV